ncbi:MAG: transcriptional regulator [Acidobacteriales bacterium 59-55]|nr:helix-turn-helix transcriptional regulator [Terriglobales bacterium]OJV41185.1 MAG: transcriptional regulator [Acidobacteriales bacterium 59-55]
MKKTGKKSDFGWAQIKEFCDSLTDEEDALTREMVTCISDKWSLWTMSVIAEQARPMRFSRIMEQVEGVSQKSLTKTLRGLERDGLITRKVFAEVPPRVEYAMTPLGSEMLENIAPLWLWVAKSVQRFQDARAAYSDR